MVVACLCSRQSIKSRHDKNNTPHYFKYDEGKRASGGAPAALHSSKYRWRLTESANIAKAWHFYILHTHNWHHILKTTRTTFFYIITTAVCFDRSAQDRKINLHLTSSYQLHDWECSTRQGHFLPLPLVLRTYICRPYMLAISVLSKCFCTVAHQYMYRWMCSNCTTAVHANTNNIIGTLVDGTSCPCTL